MSATVSTIMILSLSDRDVKDWWAAVSDDEDAWRQENGESRNNSPL